jgi:hypothetical protein
VTEIVELAYEYIRSLPIKEGNDWVDLSNFLDNELVKLDIVRKSDVIYVWGSL